MPTTWSGRALTGPAQVPCFPKARPPYGANRERSRPASNTEMSKKILIISPTPSHPQTAGNRSRILSFAESFRSLGHEVDFVCLGMESGDEQALRAYWGDRYHSVPYTRPRNRLRALRRRAGRLLGYDDWRYTCGVDDWYDPALGEAVQALHRARAYDTVVAEYVFLSKVLEGFDGQVRKVLDTHDVFTRRHERYLAEGMKPRWFSTTRAEEARGLARADTIVAIQGAEAEYFRSITDKEVVTIGHSVELSPLNGRDVVPGRLLFVGSRNVINVRAVELFMDKVLPEVKARVAQAHLAVAGSVCDEVSDHPDMVKLGVVDELSQAYACADIVVIPMSLGTGLKIKTIEALGYGKPVVSTAVGAEGLEPWAGSAFRSVDHVRELGAAIVDLLGDPQRKARYADEARRFAREWNARCAQGIERLV